MCETSQMDLVRLKRDNFNIQIRKQKREEIFKQKRVINGIRSMLNDELEYFLAKKLLQNPDMCEQYIQSLQEQIKSLYQGLPHTMNEIISKFKSIKTIQQEEQEDGVLISTLILKNDLVRYLSIFLDNQYSHNQEIQLITLTIISNFIGHINGDFQFYQDYLNIVSTVAKVFLRNFKGYIVSSNNELVQMALYCFGNMAFDDFQVFSDFLLEDNGFEVLLELGIKGINVLQYKIIKNYQVDLIIWILSCSFSRNYVVLDKDSLQRLLPLLEKIIYSDTKIIKQNSDTLFYCLETLNWMSDKRELAEAIVQRKVFDIIINLSQTMESRIADMATTIVCNCSCSSDFDFYVLKNNLIEILNIKLSSFSNSIKKSVIFCLGNIIQDSDQIFEQVFSHPTLINKVLACGYIHDEKLISEVTQFLLNVTDRDEDNKYTQKLFEKDIITLIYHLLGSQRESILINTLDLLYHLSDLNEAQQMGNINKIGPVILQLTQKNVLHRIMSLQQNYSEKVIQKSNDILEYLEISLESK